VIYARLPQGDRARLHGGTKIPLDAGTLTRGQTQVLAAWFNSARWGCDSPAEKLEANAVGGSTIVLKCEDNVVEFCLQSPEQGIWKKLTIACAPERAEWVRDGLPLLPTSLGSGDWGGGTLPPEPPLPRMPGHWGYYAVRDLYGAYASLPADVLREVCQGKEVTLSLAELSPAVRDGIVACYDKSQLADSRGNRWPEEFFRTPEVRKRYFGIDTVTLSYRRGHLNNGNGRPLGVQCLASFPRPYRVVYMELHLAPWAVAERVRIFTTYNNKLTEYAKYPTVYLVALPAEVQRRLCAFVGESKEWHDRWLEEIPMDIGHGHRVKPGAPPRPEPWP